MSILQSLHHFASSDNPKELVSLGYEIETNWKGGERTFDTEGFYDSYDLSDDEIIAYLGLPWDRRWVDTINRENSDGLLGAFQLDRDTILESALECEQNNEDSPYWCNTDKNRQEIDGFHRQSDGSVTGWEYVTLKEDNTEGGVSYDRAIALARRFYAELPSEFSIEEDCSCHVHIQVQGISQHIGSYRLYMLIIDELSTIWASEDIPNSIADRIRICNSYYAPRLSHTEKYNTVRVHPQGTWEFRLWGNTQDVDEVQYCLDSTISAFQKAYKRYLSPIEDTLFQKVANSGIDFSVLATGAMKKLLSIDTILSKVSPQ
jgi:hypothetical protein